jgi:serine phosphatase RsbU (regulator of sigma subunit)
MEAYSPAFSPQPGFEELLILQQQVARLQALLQASRQVHRTISLRDVLMTALEIAVRELEVPGAAITNPKLQYGEMPDEPWDSCARFPLPSEGSVSTGDLVVACTRKLTLSEEDFLEGLVLQTAVAAQNARFHERDLEWARVQQDLDAARVLQRSLLPERMPDVAGYDFAVRSTTCFEVGGDYVDIIELPDGEQVMIVADVAGKGLASAIVSTAFRAGFRALAITGLPLKTIARRLNQHHWDEGPETRRKYVTALLMRLDLRAGRLEIVNAGHNPGFLLLPGESAPRMLMASGPPLGMLAGMQYETEYLPFPEGARLLVYTDGLTEVYKEDYEEFGESRLLEAFQGSAALDGADTLVELWNTIGEFSGNQPQVDDMTALAVSRTPRMNPSNPSTGAS